MIPLRDTIPSSRRPMANILLIAVNVAVFAYEWFIGHAATISLVHTYGLVPQRYTEMGRFFAGGGLASFVPFVSSLFLHGGPFHIFSNMLYLWVFGDNVEDRMGHLKYVLFYIGCGIAAGLSHIFAQPDSAVPAIGASGAVAGVLGAYMVSFPRARVIALIPLGIFLHVAQLPAVVFLLFWFGMQLLNGVAAITLAARVSLGVAWWAHIGGFVAGAILVQFLREKRNLRPT